MRIPGRRSLALGVAGALAGAGVLMAIRPVGPLPHAGWFLLLVVPAMLLAHARWPRLGPGARALVTGALIALALIQGQRTSRQIALAAADPPEWDFSSFWIAGRVAAAGRDFYHPGHFDELMGPLDASPEFRAEILNVGFWYPPPTMLLLLPIGGLDVAPAARLWYAINGLAIAADVALVWWLFLRSMGWTGLALSAGLVSLMPGTFSTIRYAQSNAIALLFLLLCWHERHRMRGGVWLALAAIIKPVAACLVIYGLIRRRWRMLGGALVAGLASIAATAGFFGWDTTLHYVRSNPLVRLPDYVYTQTVNQSLPAALLRALGDTPGASNPLLHPWVFAACVVVVAVSAWRVWRRDVDDRTAFSIVLVAGLLIYPATLVHYSMIAILPILSLWASRGRGPAAPAVVPALAGVVYALAAGDAGAVLPVYLVLWVGTIVCSHGRPAEPARAAMGVQEGP
jgi:hypothetical protein